MLMYVPVWFLDGSSVVQVTWEYLGVQYFS